MIVIDSSVIVDFLRAGKKQETQFVRLAGESEENLVVSIVTHTELYSGRSVWESKKALEDLEVVLSQMTIVGIDTALSKVAGKLVARYGMSLADAVIAATTIEQKALLATLNRKHFKMIKGLELYRF
jgi:predicted nucleic acid-binding protein